MIFEQVSDQIFRFEDGCNVYVIVRDDDAIAIDFGTGAWQKTAEANGLPPISHVLLTHNHVDQCEGLLTVKEPNFVVHASVGTDAVLAPKKVEGYWKRRRLNGVPASYSVLPHGIPDVKYHLAGFTDWYWGEERVRILYTPGHSEYAISYIIDDAGKQFVFCGDAAHAGGTIYELYHLEWDHWTGSGALAAWEGVERLLGVKIDGLCPSHGPVVSQNVRPTLKALSRRLLTLYRAKGNINAGAPDDYLKIPEHPSGARELLPNFYQFGNNGILLQAANGECLVFDPTVGDIPPLESLLQALGNPTVSAATATHYHLDHTDGLPVLQEKFGARTYLHPWVAAPLADVEAWDDVPWQPKAPIVPDEILPEHGSWTWNEFTLQVQPFPGQTWWHSCFLVEIAGKRVLIDGDSFQPASRWNGTGGFCAYNGCRFEEGFAQSAQTVLDMNPHILVNGHNTYTRMRRSRFKKIIKWSKFAESAIRDLCPDGDMERHYYLHTDKQALDWYR